MACRMDDLKMSIISKYEQPAPQLPTEKNTPKDTEHALDMQNVI